MRCVCPEFVHSSCNQIAKQSRIKKQVAQPFSAPRKNDKFFFNYLEIASGFRAAKSSSVNAIHFHD